MSADDARQTQRTAQEIDRDAQALRGQLQAQGINPADLEGALSDLRGLENQAAYNDPKALEKLRLAALDKLQKLDFALRRKLESGNDSLALSGSDEVPAGFRQKIEEYYRALAKKQAQSSQTTPQAPAK